jgi:hypothetical protein
LERFRLPVFYNGVRGLRPLRGMGQSPMFLVFLYFLSEE